MAQLWPRLGARPGPRRCSLRELVELVNLDPANPAPRARLAACLVRAGRFAEAETQISACLRLCEGRVMHPSKRLLLVALRRRALAASRRQLYRDGAGLLGA